MKKILLISDTHGDETTYKVLIQQHQPYLALHAGDYCSDEKAIQKHFDYYVAGNNDFSGPRIVNFQIEKLNCRLMHGDQFDYLMISIFDTKKRDQQIWQYAQNYGIDILIHGHTHIESFMYKDNILVINPGSLKLPRNQNHKPSYAIIYIKDSQFVMMSKEEIFHYL